MLNDWIRLWDILWDWTIDCNGVYDWVWDWSVDNNWHWTVTLDKKQGISINSLHQNEKLFELLTLELVYQLGLELAHFDELW